MKVAEFIMARLAFHGIRQAYCVTGGAAMHLNDALGAEPGITVRYLHHEQACAMAAEGYARINWTPALVQVTAGPGALNALNGVFGAYTDSVPMVIVSGQVRSDTISTRLGPVGLRQLGDQEMRTLDVVRPITKWAAQVQSDSNLTALVDEAFAQATSGRPGPSWIDVPVDIQGQQTCEDPNGPVGTIVASVAVDLDDVAARIVSELAAASRPLILAGTGVRVAGCQGSLMELAEALDVPVVTAWTHDTVPADHRLNAGRPGTIGTRAGNFAVQCADLVVVLGSRLNIRQVSYNWQAFAKNARVIHVDVDPAELGKHYLNTTPVSADLRDLMPRLVTQTEHLVLADREPWLKWIRSVRGTYEPAWSDYQERDSGINPYHFVMALSERLTAKHIVVCGDATACIVPFQVLQLQDGARMFSNSGCASMGYDLPAALGAADAAADRPVVALAGDGSVMMNLQELQSLRDSNRDIVLFILDNGGYLSIKQTQRNFFGRDFGNSPDSGVGFPDFAAVARGFGLPSRTLARDADWQRELDDCLSEGGPRVCVVALDVEQEFEPRLRSKMTVDGIVTPALDDMYPHLDGDELEAVRQRAMA